MERWLPVVGWEALYEVSSLGNVRRKGAKVLRRTPLLPTTGYPSIRLCNTRANSKTFTVHSLVAEAFLGPRPAGHDVMHRDGSRTNNSVENLSYGTRSENNADKLRHGTHNRGERHYRSRLTEAQARVILNDATRSHTEIAREIGVDPQTVADVRVGRSWAWLAEERADS